MRFVCDAPGGRTWFQIETEDEAQAEGEMMRHAVHRYFQRELNRARASYRPADPNGIERDIGLKAHIARTMPIFLTLRDEDGAGVATAMLPQGGGGRGFQIVIVGPGNSNPYPAAADAIAALEPRFGLELPEEDCYPYAK
jgi:hypothetical protein